MVSELRLVVAGTRDAAFEDIPIFIAAIRRWISRNVLIEKRVAKVAR